MSPSLTRGLTALAVLLLAACSWGSAGQPSLGPSLPSSAFACRDRAGGTPGVLEGIHAVSFAALAGYEQITFEFAPSGTGPVGIPAYSLTRQASARFTPDAYHPAPPTYGGGAGLKATFKGITEPGPISPPSGQVVAGVNLIAGGYGGFAASYGIALARPACFRVAERSGPARLEIDFDATGAPAPWPQGTS